MLAVRKGDRSSGRVLDEARATSLAADAEHLYWTAAPGEVRAVPHTGGAVETLVAGQSRPDSLAAPASERRALREQQRRLHPPAREAAEARENVDARTINFSLQ